MTEERPGTPQNSSADYLGTNLKPLLVLGAVVLVLAVVFNQSSSLARDEESQSSSDSFSDVAIMGGVKRTNLSKDFKGGGATGVMGGVEIDLRDATMERDQAVLDVSSIMGGVKIRVPESWTVVSRVSSVMGGFDDSTRHPAKDDHRLLLKGTVVMGGLKVSN